ncbi:MAG: hypothetical protein AB7D37_03690 [Desulfovibrio sp.]
MTGMGFSCDEGARLINALLAEYRFEARVNHRGQYFYQARAWWRGRPVLCRLAVPDLSRLPDSLFTEIWCGYYDANEPESMLDDAVYPHLFACLGEAGFGPGDRSREQATGGGIRIRPRAAVPR